MQFMGLKLHRHESGSNASQYTDEDTMLLARLFSEDLCPPEAPNVPSSGNPQVSIVCRIAESLWTTFRLCEVPNVGRSRGCAEGKRMC